MKNQVDRLPPHSLEAEMGVIGCALLSPNECIDECIEKFGANGTETFYDLRHRGIFSELVLMRNEMISIDIITLQQRLKDKQLLEQIGGIAYLASLQDSVPSAANLSYYLEIVREKHLLRRMIQTCTQAVADIYEFEGEVEALLDEVEKNILSVRPAKTNADSNIKTLCQEAIDSFEYLFQSRGAIRGLSTGLPDLDRKTDGLHGGEMIIIAAYPSCGKSTLAANIAVHNALNGGIDVLFLSAEMNPAAIVMRAICAEARVNLYDIRDGIATEADFKRIASQVSKLSKTKLHVEKASGMTIGQAVAVARRFRQKHGTGLVVVDYMQRLSCPDKKVQNREQEIAAISSGLKNIATEHNIPVIVLSQLNDDGKLRESRAPGQDTDSLWIISNDGERQPRVQSVTLSIEKSRDGEVGAVPLTFFKTFTRFESAAKIADTDVPANE
jgi:replicative DNA helicase